MKKFTLIVTIAFVCSFSVVRRNEDEDGDAVFQEAITQIMGSESLAYNVMDADESIGNGDHHFRDRPLAAANMLSCAFDEVVLVVNGGERSWLKREALRPETLFTEALSHPRLN